MMLLVLILGLVNHCHLHRSSISSEWNTMLVMWPDILTRQDTLQICLSRWFFHHSHITWEWFKNQVGGGVCGVVLERSGYLTHVPGLRLAPVQIKLDLKKALALDRWCSVPRYYLISSHARLRCKFAPSNQSSSAQVATWILPIPGSDAWSSWTKPGWGSWPRLWPGGLQQPQSRKPGSNEWQFEFSCPPSEFEFSTFR